MLFAPVNPNVSDFPFFFRLIATPQCLLPLDDVPTIHRTAKGPNIVGLLKKSHQWSDFMASLQRYNLWMAALFITHHFFCMQWNSAHFSISLSTSQANSNDSAVPTTKSYMSCWSAPQFKDELSMSLLLHTCILIYQLFNVLDDLLG